MAAPGSSQIRRSIVSITLLCLSAGAGMWQQIEPRANAASPPALEYQVKAAFLLNFTRFVEWPASAFTAPASPFGICILGRDPFGQALDDEVRGEFEDGHPITILRLAEPPAPRTCQLVFISADSRNVPKILTALGAGVLTVGDGETFLRDGGIIGFVVENRRVRFDIDQKAAEAAALKVSSRLLSVARTVRK
jgi:hypothetical protein